MARLPIPGSDEGNWGEVLNNFLSIEHNSDGTQKTLPIRRGGTGATNAEDARTNLGINSVFIQPSRPQSSGPHLWIQTKMGDKGDGFTFWIDDGE